MKFTTAHNQPSLTVELPDRMMQVTIRDDGSITVHQKGYEVGPDEYVMGGEYELKLPNVLTVAEGCSTYNADPGDYEYPATGTATIEVTHRH